MLRVIVIMLSGMAAGFALRRRRVKFVQSATTVLVWALLFFLGFEVGGNDRIIKALPTLGVEALELTIAGLTGSLLCAWGLWKHISAKAANLPEGKPEERQPQKAQEPCPKDASHANPLTGSLTIIGFFALGCLFGYTESMSVLRIPENISYITLCALMLSVGFSVGNDPQTIDKFKQLGPLMMLLPLGTIIGTLGTCALWGIFTEGRSVSDCLAVGSGFGYYSLSSIFITEYKGAELGTVALLSNIFREIITLMGAPMMVRFLGPLAPISSGGATTMDTTLPIISRTSGRSFVILSIFHGFIVDFSVPFLVTLFCSI